MGAPGKEAARGAFSPQESREHEAGFEVIRAGLAAGLDFDAACARIEASDAELRRIIIDDYLKVTIAERHFQGRESTAAVASALRVPIERVERARQEMLSEVAAASVEVFRGQGGQMPEA